MATVKHAIHEHDVVALRHHAGRWPAGTIGAVVSERGEHKLIEIADDQGVMLDLISQPESQLDLVSKHSD
jgi:hypothetical protein